MVDVVELPSAGSGSVLDIHGLTYRIKERLLFDGLDLVIAAGEAVAVMGPSGSGKSTLLSCALGLVKPDRGAISVAGVDISGLRGKALARHRSRSMGMVFQFGELLPELSPVDNVALAALLGRSNPKAAFARAAALLDELGVPEVATSDRLSGGERQRTAVARALINSPELLLADEPTGALDRRTRDHVGDVLFSVPARHRCGLLVVTHDPAIAERADRVLHLEDGVLQHTDTVSAGEQ